MFKKGGMFSSNAGIWKPKNIHCLEYLKYLHGVLEKNRTVTESNRASLVEALRVISEILIWGDQNDATVFDFFLEKNMLSFFLDIMKSKSGRYVCVQLLQTLNILFENIRHETSLYFLLSNNHVNSIITHRFDFSDEEIIAYYISFLKTLSFKLNKNTVHFFFNEGTNDFPLYTEAIKFFNHTESMVRIAVRTLTLNVYKVDDQAMQVFIRNRTAAPYFSNLVWFVGNHIVDINNYITANLDDNIQIRLNDQIAEHLDHVHYINDILNIETESLNDLLCDQLVHRLLSPIYLGSLVPHLQPDMPHVSKVMALFLLSQMFLTISYGPLVERLLFTLLFGDLTDLVKLQQSASSNSLQLKDIAESSDQTSESEVKNENNNEEEKCTPECSEDVVVDGSRENIENRPLYSSFLNALDCSESDHTAFFALTNLYAIGRNSGVPVELVEKAGLCRVTEDERKACDHRVVYRLVSIIVNGCEDDSKVRLITFELCCLVLRQLILVSDTGNVLQDQYYAELVSAKESITAQLVSFFQSEELFLDLFEDEYAKSQNSNFKIDMVSCDAALLVKPISTPLSGVEFSKRLPCGNEERARRAIRVYLLVRQLLMDLDGAAEHRLPLKIPDQCVAVDKCLDLNNSDLLSCSVINLKNNSKVQRFLVTDGLQLILVEPDGKRLGWGVVTFVGYLQDVEMTGDKEDSRALVVTVHDTLSKRTKTSLPLLNARFVFDDHIRCMAAKQRLTKGRQKARQFKMDLIAELLEIPTSAVKNASKVNASPMSFRSLKKLSTKVPGYPSSMNMIPPDPTTSTPTKKKNKPKIPAANQVLVEAGIPLEEIKPNRSSTPESIPGTPKRYSDNSQASTPNHLEIADPATEISVLDAPESPSRENSGLMCVAAAAKKKQHQVHDI